MTSSRGSRGSLRGSSTTRCRTIKFATLIEKNILDQVCHFKPLQYEQVVVPRNADTGSAMFEPRLKDMSLPQAMKFAGFAASPDFYGPGPENTYHRVADMVQCRDVARGGEGAWYRIRDRWLCTLVGSAPMVLRRVGTDMPWMWALGHIGGSAALGWEATCSVHEGQSFWGFSLGADALRWMVVTSLHEWEGYNLDFLPPVAQLIKMGLPVDKGAMHNVSCLAGHSSQSEPEEHLAPRRPHRFRRHEPGHALARCQPCGLELAGR